MFVYRFLILVTLGLLVGCTEDVQKLPRFMTEPVMKKKISLVQFSDGHSFKIECVRVAKNGDRMILWEEVLEPLSDGLGAWMYISVESQLTVAGRGEEPFIHSIPDFNTEEIDYFTQGRNASLNPSNIVWVCMLNGDLGSVPALKINPLSEEISETVEVCRKYQAEAIILRASRLSESESE